MNEQNQVRFDRNLTASQEAFEAGFLSEAARKRAREPLSRAYSEVKEGFTRHVEYDRISWDMPFELHQVREKHFELAASRGYAAFEVVRDLIALREAINAAEIRKIEKVETEAEKLQVRALKSLSEMMEMRKTQYETGLSMLEIFGSLNVTANAHWVHGHKGTVFLRHFWYMDGKLTPLNMICAIFQEHARREEAKKEQA